MKNKLKIMLITYNRAYYLERTLKQILADNSPIKDFDITILNNASTDKTDDIINKYQKKFPNLKHIKHPINIGGNANIVRAFELGVASGKEYVWVLCDDDWFDFNNWNEVITAASKGADCIGVARYALKDDQLKSPAAQFLQLTFVPAGIYKTSIITDTVLTNMYDTIYTMFQQSCIAASLINNKKKIIFLREPIVDGGLNREDKNAPEVDCSYTRGYNLEEVSFRRKEQNWIIGFSNIIRLLKDTSMQYETMEVSILFKDICGSWKNFYDFIGQYRNTIYFNEIIPVLPPEQRKKILDQNYNFKLNHSNKKWLQKIFSAKNSKDKKHKVITILGIKFKFKRKKKVK